MENRRSALGKLLTIGILLFFNLQVTAQSYVDSLAQEDHDILSSIAPYQPDVRSAILDVSQYPQALVKLERVQARSSQSFQDLVSPFSREDQEKLYEISRFPDLVNKLTANEKMNPDEVKTLLKDFPTASQTRMLSVYATHYDDLVKMKLLYQSSQDALQKIIAAYPMDVQQDFQKVVSMPDVMNLLTENIDLTVSLGEEFKSDPNGIRQQLDSLSATLTAKNTEDLAAYKKQVESDPKLQEEMKTAATDFSASYNEEDNPTYVTNNYYDNYPYPYWFSYPYWYTTPIWYPRPMYYHTGFYYGAGGNLVVVGLPSHLYSSWFFGSGYRRYPLLYNHYNSYYQFHRNNVYRGFNSSAREHFGQANHLNAPSRGREANTSSRNLNTNRRPSLAVPNNEPGNVHSSSPVMRNARSNQMQVSPGNVNRQGMQQFHATTYHSMGWQNVGGARSGVQRPAGSTMQRTSGGSRPTGGGGRGRH